MRDLPTRSRPRPAWTRPISDRLTPAIKVLVVASTLLFLFYLFVPPSQAFLREHLAVGPRSLRGEVWQLGSGLFVQLDLWGYVFNMIGLWFVGASIERSVGTPRFLEIFFAAGVLANLALAAVARLVGSSQVQDGCGFAVLALFVAFGRMYDQAQTQVLGALFMKARHLAMIFVGWALIAYLVRGDLPGVAGTVVASALGFLLARGGLTDLWAGLRLRRMRRRYRVIEGGRSGGGKPSYLN